jgi:hypothetical protein
MIHSPGGRKRSLSSPSISYHLNNFPPPENVFPNPSAISQTERDTHARPKPMTTKAQIAANRQNAQRSTGPRTAEGKARVRQNALTHGLCAFLKPGPSLGRLRADLRNDLHPATAAEEALVGELARCLMLEHRASRLLNLELDFNHPDANLVLTMRRYLNNAERSYYRALENLRNLQHQRNLQEIGFVSQKPKKPS